MEDESDEVCKLIEQNWDFLSENDQKNIELAHKSMTFFIELEEFSRFSYEYNVIRTILKQAEW